jgi:hypothetical protein
LAVVYYRNLVPKIGIVQILEIKEIGKYVFAVVQISLGAAIRRVGIGRLVLELFSVCHEFFITWAQFGARDVWTGPQKG